MNDAARQTPSLGSREADSFTDAKNPLNRVMWFDYTCIYIIEHIIVSFSPDRTILEDDWPADATSIISDVYKNYQFKNRYTTWY